MNRTIIDPALNDGIFIIFGITGDLAHRKLLPALYELVELNLLSENFRIVGTTRRQTEIEDIISSVRSSVSKPDENTLNKLRGIMRMVHMDIGNKEQYGQLKHQLDEIEDEIGVCLNRLFYLAVPAQMFEPVVEGLSGYDLSRGCQHGNKESRLLIEKPFGYDTNSALALIQRLEQVFKEQEIYRVDHYLAKETAQNILTFRMNNPIFKAVWNRESIDHILITASEEIDVEGRSNFYDNTGALRDLIQSHLLQLLALTTMEEPSSRSAGAIHASKLQLLESIQPIGKDWIATDTVRGQYDGYKEEVGDNNSNTETYAAIKLQINNDRWRDVPILLRTGKALQEKVTEITLVFKARDSETVDKNMLTIRIQPNEGIVLSFLAKKPSLVDETETVQMEFCYNDSFTGKQPDAYEKVLTDAIRGDKTLFTTDAEALASWRILEAVLDAWKQNGDSLIIYNKGSWGPVEADLLAKNSGADWLTGRLHIYSGQPR